MSKMEGYPLVSVIVPAYKLERYIAECIESILAQDYPAKEVIVVDDGSPDRTGEICRQYGDQIKYIARPNSGSPAAPRNTGLRNSRGVFVTFFDGDDVMMPGKLSAQVKFLLRHPEAVCVNTDYETFDPKGPWESPHFHSCPLLREKAGLDRSDVTEALLTGEDFRLILAQENFSSANSAMYRRDAVESVGGYDESLPASEDYLLNYRVARLGPGGIMTRVGFLHRLHDSNVTWNQSRMHRFLIVSREKALQAESSQPHRNALKQKLTYLYCSGAVDLARRRQSGWLRDLLESVKHGLPLKDAAMALLRCLKYAFMPLPAIERTKPATPTLRTVGAVSKKVSDTRTMNERSETADGPWEKT